MNHSSANKDLSPSQLATLAGVSTDTLRYYERKRLLAPARSPNGYRRYSAGAVDRVRLIRRALAIGMSLNQISGVLKVREAGGSPCRQVRDLAAAKLKELEEAAREIELVSSELRSLIKSWDATLSATPAGGQALLLESLPDSSLTSQQLIRDLSGARKKRAKKRKETTNEI